MTIIVLDCNYYRMGLVVVNSIFLNSYRTLRNKVRVITKRDTWMYIVYLHVQSARSRMFAFSIIVRKEVCNMSELIHICLAIYI